MTRTKHKNKGVHFMTSTEFKKHLAAAGFPPSIHGNKTRAAGALGVTTRTLERYLANGCHSKPVINLLLTMVYGVNQSNAWHGWRITAQYLVTPDGAHIRQSDILTLWANRKAKKHLEARLDNVERMLKVYQDRDKANKVQNLEKFKEVSKLANEIENVVGHYQNLQRTWLG